MALFKASELGLHVREIEARATETGDLLAAFGEASDSTVNRKKKRHASILAKENRHAASSSWVFEVPIHLLGFIRIAFHEADFK